MNQNIFFRYDHHFGHTNINRLSERPFVSVMNLELTKQRNERVNSRDIAYK
jgi:calcineurin-like phosphoesterase family protein